MLTLRKTNVVLEQQNNTSGEPLLVELEYLSKYLSHVMENTTEDNLTNWRGKEGMLKILHVK